MQPSEDWPPSKNFQKRSAMAGDLPGRWQDAAAARMQAGRKATQKVLGEIIQSYTLMASYDPEAVGA